MSIFHRKDYFYSYLAAIFIYIVTAFFSIGYEHPNEHFRIIELALLKMGVNQPADLQGLFAAQVQSGFQPFLAFISLKLLTFLGIYNPFTQMAIIRAFMGLFCLLASLAALKALLPSIKEEALHLPLIILTPLLWFMPFISVRFSAETLSGSLFLLAFALVFLRRNPHSTSVLYRIPWIIPGLLMGLSFEVYYRVGIMIFFMLIWLVFFGKEQFIHILSLLSGILIGIALGILANYWLYGEFCYPLFNKGAEYISMDITRQPLGKSYYWFLEIFMSGGFVVGIIIVLCLFSFWIRHLTNPVTWVTLPYLIFCFFSPDILIITLFTPSFFVPYIVMYSGQDYLIVTEKHIGPKFSTVTFNILALLFIISNSLFISMFAFKAADPTTATIKHIDRQYNPQDILLLYADGSNPYETQGPKPIRKTFYWPQNLEMHNVSTLDDLQANYSRQDKIILLCVQKAALDAGFVVDPEKFVLVYESLPHEYFSITSNYWEKDYESLLIYQYNNCKLLY